MDNRVRWTPEEDALILSGLKAPEVSERTGRTVYAIHTRKQILDGMRRNKRQSSPPPPPPQRKCLSCRQPFITTFKTIFICQTCKETEGWRAYDMA